MERQQNLLETKQNVIGNRPTTAKRDNSRTTTNDLSVGPLVCFSIRPTRLIHSISITFPLSLYLYTHAAHEQIIIYAHDKGTRNIEFPTGLGKAARRCSYTFDTRFGSWASGWISTAFYKDPVTTASCAYATCLRFYFVTSIIRMR